MVEKSRNYNHANMGPYLQYTTSALGISRSPDQSSTSTMDSIPQDQVTGGIPHPHTDTLV
jgi:hypothetical protein